MANKFLGEDGLTALIGKVKQGFNSLAGRISTNEGNITTLQTDVSTLQTDVSAITGGSGLDTKYDKTGGTISGDATVLGSLAVTAPQESTQASDGQITAKTISTLGNINIGAMLTVAGTESSILPAAQITQGDLKVSDGDIIVSGTADIGSGLVVEENIDINNGSLIMDNGNIILSEYTQETDETTSIGVYGYTLPTHDLQEGRIFFQIIEEDDE